MRCAWPERAVIGGSGEEPSGGGDKRGGKQATFGDKAMGGAQRGEGREGDRGDPRAPLSPIAVQHRGRFPCSLTPTPPPPACWMSPTAPRGGRLKQMSLPPDTTNQPFPHSLHLLAQKDATHVAEPISSRSRPQNLVAA